MMVYGIVQCFIALVAHSYLDYIADASRMVGTLTKGFFPFCFECVPSHLPWLAQFRRALTFGGYFDLVGYGRWLSGFFLYLARGLWPAWYLPFGDLYAWVFFCDFFFLFFFRIVSVFFFFFFRTTLLFWLWTVSLSWGFCFSFYVLCALIASQVPLHLLFDT